MMQIETLKQEILALSPEEKAQLMQAIGPALCESLMNHPETMQAMAPMCREMMARRPDMMKQMCDMMMAGRNE